MCLELLFGPQNANEKESEAAAMRYSHVRLVLTSQGMFAVLIE